MGRAVGGESLVAQICCTKASVRARCQILVEDGFRGSGRQEMSNYLAQNRLAFGLDRSVAVVTWAAKARFRVLPCRVIARAGLRWCGGWRRVNLRGSHDQA